MRWGKRRPPRMRHRRSRQAFTALNVVILLGGFLVFGAAGAGAYFLPVLIAGVQQFGHRADIVAAAPSSTGPAPSPAETAGSPFTVLLLGSDDDSKYSADHVLSQSMILVRVDPAGQRITMLSIPRDLWVPLSTGGSAKIDAAYAYGGAAAAIATVECNFHVHVDDYAWIGLRGLIKVIDRMGGVSLVANRPVLDDFYPNDIDTNNPYGYARVVVLAGPQRFNGAQALEYVRSRHSDLQGDFGRSQRQQQVLLALRAKAGTLNLTDLPDIATALQGEFKTSMSLTRIRNVIGVAQRAGPATVRQIVLPSPYTTGTHINDQDVLLPRWELILPLVRESFP